MEDLGALLGLGAVAGSALQFVLRLLKSWLDKLSSKWKFTVILILDIFLAVGVVYIKGDFNWGDLGATLLAVFAAGEIIYQKYLKQTSGE